MTDRPIIFKGEMVRAILDSCKNQTRRIIDPQPGPSASLSYDSWKDHWYCCGLVADCKMGPWKCPYGVVGDRLWVPENFYVLPEIWAEHHDEQPIHYCADTPKEQAEDYVCKPSIHMPRWASRITLEVTAVRVQRVQEISEEDAQAEGAPLCDECSMRWGRGAIDDPLSNAAGGRPWQDCRGSCEGLTAKEWFHAIWDSINGLKTGCAWKDNPWVWAITFKRVEMKS